MDVADIPELSDDPSELSDAVAGLPPAISCSNGPQASTLSFSGSLRLKGLRRAFCTPHTFTYDTPPLSGDIPYRIRLKKLASDLEYLCVFFYYGKNIPSSAKNGVYDINITMKFGLESRHFHGRKLKASVGNNGWGNVEFCLIKDLKQNTDLKKEDLVILEYKITKCNTPHLLDVTTTRAHALSKQSRALFNHKDTADVCFVFPSPSGSKSIFAHSVVLTAVTTYFKTMLQSGFCEGNSEDNTTQTGMSDASHVETLDGPMPNQLSKVPARKTITIKEDSYQAYRALIFFLYTGSVAFAPLDSTYEAARAAATAADPDAEFPSEHVYKTNHAQIISATGQWHPPNVWACPKELYSLADRLDIADLKAAAGAQIIAFLTTENAVTELLSPFTARYPEFQEKQTAYITENWNGVVASNAFTDVVASLEDKYAQGASALILQILRKLQPPKKG